MSVIVIGDQGVGKTTLMLELAKSKNGNVQVISPSITDLQKKFTNNGNIIPTDNTYNTNLQVKVNLFGYFKEFNVNWIDTAGEAWRPNSIWQTQNHNDWKDTLESLENAKVLMIILAPHRQMLEEELVELVAGKTNFNKKDTRFRSRQQWKNRFQEWFDFLEKHCQKTDHILFCLNMADLFCDVVRECELYQKNSTLQKIKWYEHKERILQQSFVEVAELIDTFDMKRRIPVQLFVTTYYKRILLELPWIYIGTYLK
ncbi:MAG: ATP-binding protein [Nostoc sp. DedQUE11]|nr:ATP-binding protein [Nostoc sp. DedQUE11]